MPNVIEITDFSAPELDIYARLTEAQLRSPEGPEGGVFVAESPKVIQRAMDSGCTPVSFLVERRHLTGQAREVLEQGGDVPVYTAEFDVLTQLTGFKLTRGMLCTMRRPPGQDHGAGVRRRPAHRHSGGCDEPHQHRGHLPLRRRPGH